MKILIFFNCLFFVSFLYSQGGVSINNTGVNPSTSSMLDVSSTSKGILIPRLSLTGTTDATTITNGNIVSLLVYNTVTVSDVTPGYYFWNGTVWQSLGADADSDPFNEIELPATATTGQVLSWNGTDWVAQNSASGADNWGSDIVNTSGTNITGDGTTGSPIVVTEIDGSITNEIQDLAINTTTNRLTITNNGTPTSIDLTPYLDNIDSQNLTSSATGGNATVNISNGTSTTFSINDADFDPTNEIELPTGGTIGQVLSTDGSGTYTWVTDGTGTDVQNIQNLAFNNTTNILTVGIQNGTSQTVDLTSLLTEIDGSITNEIQDLAINTTTNILTITNNGTPTSIDLTPYLDNTDTQNIIGSSFNATTGDLVIGIQNGTSQTLNFNGLKDHDWYKVGTTTAPTTINDNIFTQGNVGIGVTNPSRNLEIGNESILYLNNGATGSIRYKDDSIIFIGPNSGSSANGSYMTLSGIGAGKVSLFPEGGSPGFQLSVTPTGTVIGAAIPDASAKLDVSSGNQGFLPPRVALTGSNDIATITAPATGLLVYNTASANTGVQIIEPGYYYFNGTTWKPIGENSDWYLDNTNSFAGNLPLASGTANALYTGYINLQKGVYFVNFYDCMTGASQAYYVQTTAESSAPIDFYSGFMNYNFTARTSFSHAGFVIYVKKNGTPVRFKVWNPAGGSLTHTVGNCSGFNYYKISE